MKELLGLGKSRVGLDRAVELAHRHIGLDVAYVAELTGGRQVYRAVAGDADSFKIALDDGPLADTTYCHRLVAGEIPNVIPDTAVSASVASMPLTRDAGIGAYIGVPLRLSDGTLYGTFCCLSHAPDYTLDGREVRFMSMVGELIVDDLDDDRRREQLRADVEELIESERVDVAYQPIIDLRDSRCLGIEALARFPAPFVGAAQTLASSAEFGLSIELERLVVRRAWGMIDQLGPGQFLSLNLTPIALLELARRANLRDDLPLAQLVVEVTEHAAVNSYAPLRKELAPLREQGLRLAVDDAGAGYASLRHVLELRPDFIKLDRSLCHGVAGDHARRVAVTGLVLLALDLGATVVAEGVERPADLTALRALGLDAAQGYLLGAPTTDTDAIARWVGSTQANGQAVRDS